jgi:hypothetical protein
MLLTDTRFSQSHQNPINQDDQDEFETVLAYLLPAAVNRIDGGDRRSFRDVRFARQDVVYKVNSEMYEHAIVRIEVTDFPAHALKPENGLTKNECEETILAMLGKLFKSFTFAVRLDLTTASWGSSAPGPEWNGPVLSLEAAFEIARKHLHKEPIIWTEHWESQLQLRSRSLVTP